MNMIIRLASLKCKNCWFNRWWCRNTGTVALRTHSPRISFPQTTAYTKCCAIFHLPALWQAELTIYSQYHIRNSIRNTSNNVFASVLLCRKSSRIISHWHTNACITLKRENLQRGIICDFLSLQDCFYRSHMVHSKLKEPADVSDCFSQLPFIHLLK